MIGSLPPVYLCTWVRTVSGGGKASPSTSVTLSRAYPFIPNPNPSSPTKDVCTVAKWPRWLVWMSRNCDRVFPKKAFVTVFPNLLDGLCLVAAFRLAWKRSVIGGPLDTWERWSALTGATGSWTRLPAGHLRPLWRTFVGSAHWFRRWVQRRLRADVLRCRACALRWLRLLTGCYM